MCILWVVACGAPKNAVNSSLSPSPTPEVIVAETAMPSPLVTLKPTATPTPKKTPAPTPPKKASATLPPVNMDIPAPKFSEAEEQYLNTASSLAQKINDANIKYEMAFKTAKIVELPAIANEYKAILTEISALKVPSKFSAVNGIFVQAVTNYESPLRYL
ncbi:MAG: hypothetical protein H7Y41_01330 [Hyphomonadaceae bacterium]|nr:hypothetical protein [Clostridia bacterium]